MILQIKQNLPTQKKKKEKKKEKEKERNKERLCIFHIKDFAQIIFPFFHNTPVLYSSMIDVPSIHQWTTYFVNSCSINNTD